MSWEQRLNNLAKEKFTVEMVLEFLKPVVKEIVEEERAKAVEEYKQSLTS